MTKHESGCWNIWTFISYKWFLLKGYFHCPIAWQSRRSQQNLIFFFSFFCKKLYYSENLYSNHPALVNKSPLCHTNSTMVLFTAYPMFSFFFLFSSILRICRYKQQRLLWIIWRKKNRYMQSLVNQFVFKYIRTSIRLYSL